MIPYPMRQFLTNGWSGWIRIAILLGFIIYSYCDLKFNIDQIQIDLTRQESVVKENISLFRARVVRLENKLDRHIDKHIGG